MIKVQVNSQGKAYMTSNGKVLLANEGGSTPTLITKSITENGSYSASSDNADGYSSVTVNVSSSTPVINSLNITPTTSSQTITAPSGTDGYSPINVSAVTSSIDSNIIAGNIKSGVTILDVTGTYEGSGGGSSSKFGISIDDFIGDVDSNGRLGFPNSINDITFTGVTEIGVGALYYRFAYRTNVFGSVAFPSLTTIDSKGLMAAFLYSRITSVNFPSLTTIGEGGLQYAFYHNQITSVNFPSLTTIGERGLQYAFADNNYLSRTTLTSVSFPALTSQFFGIITGISIFSNMLSGDEGVTVHFPSNLQNVIEGWDDVINGFGGTNTTVLFDLPATE